MSGAKKKIRLVELKVGDIIEPGERTRLEIDRVEITELAGSISEVGQLVPIEVVPNGDKYEIVFGERRWLAIQQLGLATIKAIVVEKSRRDVLLARATENIARADLSPVEEGANYAVFRDEFGMSHNDISKKVGRGAGRVKRMMDTLKMPVGMQKALHARKISPGVAEALWSCPDEAHREYLLEMAVEHGVTVAVVRMWVDDFKKSLRGKEGDGEGGRDVGAVMEAAPVYTACGLCGGPVEWRFVRQICACPECSSAIQGAKDKGVFKKGGD